MGWQEDLAAQITKAVRGLDSDEIIDAIKNELDFPKIVREMIADDPVFKMAIYNRLKKEVLRLADEWDADKDNNVDEDTFDFAGLAKQMIKEDEELRKKIYAILEEVILKKAGDWDPDDEDDDIFEDQSLADWAKKLIAEDEAVRTALTEKIRETVLSEIDDYSSLSDIESDFSLNENLPIDFVAGVVKELLATGDPDDEQCPLGALRKIVRDFLTDEVGSDDVIPDRDEFIKQLDIDALVASMLTDANMKESLNKVIIEILAGEIRNLSVGNLPKNIWQIMEMDEKIRQASADPEFMQNMAGVIKEVLGCHINQAILNGDATLTRVITGNGKVQLAVSEAMGMLMMDPAFRKRLEMTLIDNLDKQIVRPAGILNSLLAMIRKAFGSK